jgi:hypothetical protein
VLVLHGGPLRKLTKATLPEAVNEIRRDRDVPPEFGELGNMIWADPDTVGGAPVLLQESD